MLTINSQKDPMLSFRVLRASAMRRLIESSLAAHVVDVSDDLNGLLKKALRDAKTYGLKDPTGETPGDFIDNDLRMLLYASHNDYEISFDFCERMDAEINELADVLGQRPEESVLTRKSAEHAIRAAGYKVHQQINPSIRTSKAVKNAHPNRYGGSYLGLDVLPSGTALRAEGWPIDTGRKSHHGLWEAWFQGFEGIGYYRGYCRRFVRNETDLRDVLMRMSVAAEAAAKLRPRG